MSATVVRQISNAAVAQAAAEIKERNKTPKDRAREVLSSPDLNKRSQALYKALLSLKVFHPKNANQRPPSHSSALGEWCEGAQQLLRMHTAEVPKQGYVIATGPMNAVLTLDNALALGFNPKNAVAPQRAQPRKKRNRQRNRS